LGAPEISAAIAPIITASDKMTLNFPSPAPEQKHEGCFRYWIFDGAW
jgi:hypothetical protein